MSKMYKWPSTGQFKNAIKEVRYRANNENNEPPILLYEGSVKLHGSNAAVYVDIETDELVVQSRNRVLTVEQDNFNFAFFVHTHEEIFRKLCEQAKVADGTQSIIYGEWCGEGVNHGCAIHQVKEKFFMIFGVKQIVDEENAFYDSVSDTAQLRDEGSRIFNIASFPTYALAIDFSRPEQSIDYLISLTNGVEEECPVGKFFGHSGIGEGIVWRPIDPSYGADYWFKVKGEKHAGISRVKTLVPVDAEAMRNAEEFAEAVCTPARLQQGLEYLKEMDKPIDRKSTGDYLKWLIGDVMKEELDRLEASFLTPPMVNKRISTIAREWFFEQIDKAC